MHSEIEIFIASELAKAEARKAEFIESIRPTFSKVAANQEAKFDNLHIWYSKELADVIAELERQAARKNL